MQDFKKEMKRFIDTCIEKIKITQSLVFYMYLMYNLFTQNLIVYHLY